MKCFPLPRGRPGLQRSTDFPKKLFWGAAVGVCRGGDAVPAVGRLLRPGADHLPKRSARTASLHPVTTAPPRCPRSVPGKGMLQLSGR